MSMKAINSRNGHGNIKQHMCILCVDIVYVCVFSKRKKSFSRWEEVSSQVPAIRARVNIT